MVGSPIANAIKQDIMEKIKFYLIDYPVNFIKDTYHKCRMGMLDWFRKKIYNYEIKEVLNGKLSDPYWGYTVSDLRVGVLCPVMIVYKMLEKYFGFRGVYLMRIHGIDVDTQDANTITVTIRLNRPGLLIGRAGKDIDAVRDMLESYFNKKTRIDIVEVKNDINVPFCEF